MYLRRLCYLTLIASLVTYSISISAQSVDEQQINMYAQAALEIETHRQRAYQEIQTILGKTPPPIVCNQPRSYNSLPAAAEKVAISYCQTSENIVEKSGLTVTEFNQITQKISEDQELERRVQNVIIELQKP
ncbi:DUF4168 domain-containing protein [Gloeocapsa sp. PCC 73106]|uniref:DUF4168 domain-containing protein n=1 Tax=Gloeocapsa sp. PCC 73106 TaxID=102232 RepID=UPI0002ACE04E|nr:DUF4168 domain-containing protein [Gloeocapsa sp. PCC 73106]ELR98904.1 hypothetical protein GLO73106DRAFT_00027430 [Gloeocapsa sp. PCC 73106]